MKKFFLILVLFPSLLFSQWVEQQVPADVGLLISIDFVNANTGVSTGWFWGNEIEGRAIFTTNGGFNWISASVPDSSRSLVTVQMMNTVTGYCAAAYNILGACNSFSPNNRFHFLKKEPVVTNFYGRRDTVLGTRGFFLKSTNAGQSWFTHGNVPPDVFYLIGMDFIDMSTGFISAQASPYYPWEEWIYKTTDGGLNWTLSYHDQYTKSIRSICFVDSSMAFAVGYVRIENPVYPIEGVIIRTTNGGMNWSQQIFYYMNNFTDITMVNNSTGFACGVSNSDTIHRGVVYKTTNSGQNWFKLGFQIDTTILDGIEFYPSSGTGICYGTEGKADTAFPGWYLLEHTVISKTTDYGNTWQSHFNDDPDNVLVGSKMLTLANWYIAGGNPLNIAKILHTTNGGEIGIEPISSEIPGQFSLYQNYPNPFNPVTIIKFSLPLPSEGGAQAVRLVVYDILGRQIAVLLNEQLRPGSYEVTWDASNYPSGVYFYKLITDEFLKTKKMILIK